MIENKAMKIENLKINEPYLHQPTDKIVVVKTIKEIYYEWPEPIVKFPDGSIRPVSANELIELPKEK